MKQITPENYKMFGSGELADLFANNSATIVAGTFEAFKDVFALIHEAIQNGGHFRKDVRTFINLQQQWNAAAEKEIADLKTQLNLSS